ncbi:transposase, partial [Candidatus Aeolococcus gillhamiae]|uniref:transposase n=1 Tax=Candidatus Aeolococcus gillhamiae TaxID=3127015 RepID=UPI0030780073
PSRTLHSRHAATSSAADSRVDQPARTGGDDGSVIPDARCLRGLDNFRSAIDGRTIRHPGYAMSQRVRKRVEEIFGWTKTVGGGRKLRYIGQRRNEMWMMLTVATYNVVRMANLELAVA